MNYTMLCACRLFHGLTEDEIASLLSTVPYRISSFEKGEIIFHSTDPADHIAIVLRGRVQIQKVFPSGSHLQVNTKIVGDMFGEAAVFSNQRQYPCELIALEPSELLMFHREDMLQLLHTEPRILDHFLSELATATYQLQQQIELLSYTSIHQKIAFYLLSRSNQLETHAIHIPESMTKWALTMNVSRTSLHREIGKLVSTGTIAYHPPIIEIKDRGALQSLLE